MSLDECQLSLGDFYLSPGDFQPSPDELQQLPGEFRPSPSKISTPNRWFSLSHPIPCDFQPLLSYMACHSSHYKSYPTQTHIIAAKRIVHYLTGTLTKGLFYKHGSSELVDYADADFARDIDDRISTSGYVFILSGAPISWFSGKQRTVSLSTANAEYIALSEAARESLFLKQMFSKIGVQIGTVLIMQNNQATIAMTRNPMHRKGPFPVHSQIACNL